VAKAAYARQELTERRRGVRVGDLMARDCSLVDGNSNLHTFVYDTCSTADNAVSWSLSMVRRLLWLLRMR
jgi:hypothetical protein